MDLIEVIIDAYRGLYQRRINDGSAPQLSLEGVNLSLINGSINVTSGSVLVDGVPISSGSSGSSSGSTGITSVVGEKIWIVSAAQTSSAYSNGLTYVPLVRNSEDTINCQFSSTITGLIGINIDYAMSAAHTGDVELCVKYLRLNQGSDPTIAQTTGTAFTITPGNDARFHTVSSSMNSQLQLSSSYGDQFYITIMRTTGSNDTHTSDMRIIDLRATNES